ncbi:MAG: hypothetical protein IT372_08775, partial [Polyangiaceae bacterium]|nr:hypothetical protein [Polyangiaceae bacterium]
MSEPETPPDAAEPASDELEEFLDTPLSRRPLPSRMLNWADRRRVSRFRDLMAWSPERLRRERNMGEQTIRQTRALVERETRRTWEELSARVLQEAADDDALEPPPSAPGWDQIARLRDPEIAALPLADIDLPARMRGLAAREGLSTLGDLLGWPRVKLLREPNLGAATVAAAAAAIHAHLRARAKRQLAPPEPALDDYGDLAALLRQKIAALDPLGRLVITQRAGLAGEPQRFAEIGEALGVSRQRAAQIEERALAALSRDGWWIAAIEARLRGAMEGGVVPLARLAEDPFWASADEQRHVLEYVLDRLLEGRLHVVLGDGLDLIAETPQRAADEAWEDLVAEAKGLEFPASPAEVDALAARRAAGLAPAIAAALRQRLDRQLHRVEDGGAVLYYTGIGPRQTDQILAFLSASPGPVPVAELWARFGRRPLPDEVIHVDWGVVALPRHVPDFAGWSARLGPLCAAILRREGPDRQWSTTELL